MKIKDAIYFLLMIAGILVLTVGDTFLQEEYALGIGFIMLMFGLYKISTSWRREKSHDEQVDQ